ncbi:uncharacterized protein LOC142079786 isoform X1 [Calonectris borealis]|uniref:uncharacterized protein LOC142079786 isoform X1 n=1 Tax=Calonectris borealis TaxID=1323832 RepID=UPI003F4B2AB5
MHRTQGPCNACTARRAQPGRARLSRRSDLRQLRGRGTVTRGRRDAGVPQQRLLQPRHPQQRLLQHGRPRRGGPGRSHRGCPGPVPRVGGGSGPRRGLGGGPGVPRDLRRPSLAGDASWDDVLSRAFLLPPHVLPAPGPSVPRQSPPRPPQPRPSPTAQPAPRGGVTPHSAGGSLGGWGLRDARGAGSAAGQGPWRWPDPSMRPQGGGCEQSSPRPPAPLRPPPIKVPAAAAWCGGAGRWHPTAAWGGSSVAAAPRPVSTLGGCTGVQDGGTGPPRAWSWGSDGHGCLTPAGRGAARWGAGCSPPGEAPAAAGTAPLRQGSL